MLVNAKRIDVLDSILRAFVSHEAAKNAPGPDVPDAVSAIPSLVALAA